MISYNVSPKFVISYRFFQLINQFKAYAKLYAYAYNLIRRAVLAH